VTKGVKATMVETDMSPWCTYGIDAVDSAAFVAMFPLSQAAMLGQRKEAIGQMHRALPTPIAQFIGVCRRVKA
jgi:hypothetical protein